MLFQRQRENKSSTGNRNRKQRGNTASGGNGVGGGRSGGNKYSAIVKSSPSPAKRKPTISTNANGTGDPSNHPRRRFLFGWTNNNNSNSNNSNNNGRTVSTPATHIPETSYVSTDPTEEQMISHDDESMFNGSSVDMSLYTTPSRATIDYSGSNRLLDGTVGSGWTRNEDYAYEDAALLKFGWGTHAVPQNELLKKRQQLHQQRLQQQQQQHQQQKQLQKSKSKPQVIEPSSRFQPKIVSNTKSGKEDKIDRPTRTSGPVDLDDDDFTNSDCSSLESSVVNRQHSQEEPSHYRNDRQVVNLDIVECHHGTANGVLSPITPLCRKTAKNTSSGRRRGAGPVDLDETVASSPTTDEDQGDSAKDQLQQHQHGRQIPSHRSSFDRKTGANITGSSRRRGTGPVDLDDTVVSTPSTVEPTTIKLLQSASSPINGADNSAHYIWTDGNEDSDSSGLINMTQNDDDNSSRYEYSLLDVPEIQTPGKPVLEVAAQAIAANILGTDGRRQLSDEQEEQNEEEMLLNYPEDSYIAAPSEQGQEDRDVDDGNVSEVSDPQSSNVNQHSEGGGFSDDDIYIEDEDDNDEPSRPVDVDELDAEDEVSVDYEVQDNEFDMIYDESMDDDDHIAGIEEDEMIHEINKEFEVDAEKLPCKEKIMFHDTKENDKPSNCTMEQLGDITPVHPPIELSREDFVPAPEKTLHGHTNPKIIVQKQQSHQDVLRAEETIHRKEQAACRQQKSTKMTAATASSSAKIVQLLPPRPPAPRKFDFDGNSISPIKAGTPTKKDASGGVIRSVPDIYNKVAPVPDTTTTPSKRAAPEIVHSRLDNDGDDDGDTSSDVMVLSDPRAMDGSPMAVRLTEDGLRDHAEKVLATSPLPKIYPTRLGLHEWKYRQEMKQWQEQQCENIAAGATPPPKRPLQSDDSPSKSLVPFGHREDNNDKSIHGSTEKLMVVSPSNSAGTPGASQRPSKAYYDNKPLPRRLVGLFRGQTPTSSSSGQNEKDKNNNNNKRSKKQGQNQTNNEASNPVVPLGQFMNIFGSSPDPDVAEVSLAPLQTLEADLAAEASTPKTKHGNPSPHTKHFNERKEEWLIRERQRERQAQFEKKQKEERRRLRAQKLREAELQRQRQLRQTELAAAKAAAEIHHNSNLMPVKETDTTLPSGVCTGDNNTVNGSDTVASGSTCKVSLASGTVHSTVTTDSRSHSHHSCRLDMSSVASSVQSPIRPVNVMAEELSMTDSSRNSVALNPCVICHKGERSHIAMPCMHFSFCNKCATKLQQQQQQKGGPVCPVCSTCNVSFARVNLSV